MSSLKDSGSTSLWRKIRAKVIARDGCCQVCGSDSQLTVDHIIPRRLGGTDAMDNLQVLCKGCNLRKGGRFFDGASTPPRLPVLFLPRKGSDTPNQASNGSISHYQD